jgi:uncharacterized membrane protein
MTASGSPTEASLRGTRRGEPHWPPQLAVVGAIALQLLLPDAVVAGPAWLLPALEGVMLALLIVFSPQRIETAHPLRRRLALVTTGTISIANGISLVLLVRALLHHQPVHGPQLIVAGALIWLTNVLVFGLWYWEVDRGGPAGRAEGTNSPPDFLFPQMNSEALAKGWRTQFADYLYVSLTNAAAFSPTDTMPLSIAAKGLMGLQSIISLVTIGLVVARAVNIL